MTFVLIKEERGVGTLKPVRVEDGREELGEGARINEGREALGEGARVNEGREALGEGARSNEGREAPGDGARIADGLLAVALVTLVDRVAELFAEAVAPGLGIF